MVVQVLRKTTPRLSLASENCENLIAAENECPLITTEEVIAKFVWFGFDIVMFSAVRSYEMECSRYNTFIAISIGKSEYSINNI